MTIRRTTPKRLSIGILISIIIGGFVLETTHSQELGNLKPLTDNLKQIVPYTAKRSGVPVFPDATSIEALPRKLSMGELFASIVGGGTQEASTDRLRLGRLAATNEQFVEIIGWVNRSDLLESRYPLTVQRARLELGDALGAENNNQLLRVLAKPQAKIIPQDRPVVADQGDHSQGIAQNARETRMSTFSWYYVYSTARDENGEQFYLVGMPEELFPYEAQIVHTELSREASGLSGWIRARDVTPWNTNVVLEYNTSEESLRSRLTKSAPVIVYEQMDQANPGAVEPLDQWWALEGNRVVPKTQIHDLDPVGIYPSYPRFHVLGYERDRAGKEWVKVATAGATGSKLSSDETGQLLDKIREVARALRAVDVVIVIDATGSMQQEVEGVRSFLKQYVTDISQIRGLGAQQRFYTLNMPNGRSVKLDTALDIRLSLLFFKDIDAPQGDLLAPSQGTLPNQFRTLEFFGDAALTNASAATLASRFDAIDATFFHWGRDEALHYALKKALETDYFWRNEAAVRLLIVITDESGDGGLGSGKVNETDVWSAMPEAGLVSDPSRVAPRNRLTRLEAIFTGPRNEYNGFLENVDSLIPDLNIESRNNIEQKFPGYPNVHPRVHYLEEFKTNEATQSQLLFKLNSAIVDAANEVQERIKLYYDSIVTGTPIAGQGASVLIRQIAIERAARDADTSIEEIRRARIAYIDGYILKDNVAAPDDINQPLRERILLSRTRLNHFEDKLAKFTDKLNREVLLNGCPTCSAAEAVLASWCEIQGECDRQKLVSDDDYRRRELIKWLKESDELGDPTIARMVNAADHVPLTKDGLFSKTPRDLLRMERRDFIQLVQRLDRQQKCLARIILKDRVIPEDLAVMGTPLDNVAPRKTWFFTQANSTDEFVYIPIQCIP